MSKLTNPVVMEIYEGRKPLVIPELDFGMAKCFGMTTAWWFPTPSSKRIFAKKARKVCSQCEIAEQCYNYGSSTRSSGIWGGVLLTNGRTRRNKK